MRDPVHNLAVLAVCSCLAIVCGCAEMADHVNSLGSRLLMRKSPEEAMHIKTPADRIKELKQLAKSAKKKTPAEQQQIVEGLVKEFAQESDPISRRQILRTLTEYPQPAAGGVLIGALADSDTETRRTACTCLGKRGGGQAVTELSRVIASDTNFDVRIAAVGALGATGDSSALAPLAEAIIDPDPAMQAKAQESLTVVSGRDYGNDVQAWREYAKSGKTDAPEVSLAERLRRSVF
jgi:HEAT repeat protein